MEHEESGEEKGPAFPVPSATEGIKNKLHREAVYAKMKSEKKKAKKARIMERKQLEKKLGKDAPPKKVPHTIESLREYDETLVEDDDDDDLKIEEAIDSFANYYAKAYEPNVVVTTADNPHSKTHMFVRELCRIIPGAKRKLRNRSSVRKMVKNAPNYGITDIIVVNEDQRKPNGLLVIHLPDGPTAYFRMSSVKLSKDLRRSYRRFTSYRPEVILNNFKTQLGRVVARMLGALFHYEPEFKGRRACTFHNQRDYIFFRHHRYEFQSSEKVNLRELGPRFTLRLQWLQHGPFEGDYEWTLKRHEMEKSRRKFLL